MSARSCLSVSHDLRTPLTSIKGYAEAIADGTIDRNRRHRCAPRSVIEAEARRLERLVADLLDLARLDAHQFSLTPRPIDAREVVGDDGGRVRAVGARLRRGAPGRTGRPLPRRRRSRTARADRGEPRGERVEVRVVDVSDGHREPSRRCAHDPRRRRRTRHPGRRARTGLRAALHRAPGRPDAPVGTGIGLAIVHELATAMGGDARSENRSTPAAPASS